MREREAAAIRSLGWQPAYQVIEALRPAQEQQRINHAGVVDTDSIATAQANIDVLQAMGGTIMPRTIAIGEVHDYIDMLRTPHDNGAWQ